MWPCVDYEIRPLLQAQLPHLSGRLRPVLALNSCQNTVALALAHQPRGPRKQDDLVALVISVVYR